jgi:hypothetical protein
MLKHNLRWDTCSSVNPPVLGGNQLEMVDGSLGLGSHARIGIGEQGGNRRNCGHGAGTLETQSTGGVSTGDRIAIAQLLNQFQNQQVRHNHGRLFGKGKTDSARFPQSPIDTIAGVSSISDAKWQYTQCGLTTKDAIVTYRSAGCHTRGRVPVFSGGLLPTQRL